jgi:hypothetical protein
MFSTDGVTDTATQGGAVYAHHQFSESGLSNGNTEIKMGICSHIISSMRSSLGSPLAGTRGCKHRVESLRRRCLFPVATQGARSKDQCAFRWGFNGRVKNSGIMGSRKEQL